MCSWPWSEGYEFNASDLSIKIHNLLEVWLWSYAMQWNYSFACRSSIEKKWNTYVCIIHDKTNTRITNKPLILRMRGQTRATIYLGHFSISDTVCWHMARDRDMVYRHLLQALQHGQVTSTTQYYYLLLYFEHLGEKKNAHATKQHLQHLRFYAPGFHSVKLEQIILEVWLNTSLCRHLDP
jgi:hypothetical protein